MKYENIVKARFIERNNRFVAKAEILGTGEIADVHVKNTGRCRELLIPGATVYLEDFEGRMGTRKMRYSLIAVCKEDGGRLINMDSQAPNKVVHEALKNGKLLLPLPGGEMAAAALIKPEQKYGNSRFDFYVETISNGTVSGCIAQKAFIEVKGVTLENDGYARFPDAPTERGIKHIEELCRAVDDGYLAYIIFVIQMKKIHTFGPNDETHPEFGEALAKAVSKGVRILAYDCIVTEDSLILDQPVKVCDEVLSGRRSL